MKAKEIANRMSGFSTPLFGVQWTPAVLDRDIAREAIVYLEDRRALYEPFAVEVPAWVIESVLDIRETLTTLLRKEGTASELTEPLNAMRAACRKFLHRVGDGSPSGLVVPQSVFDLDGPGGWMFNQALGELRGVFGVLIGQLAIRYDLDVAEPLSSIIPTDD